MKCVRLTADGIQLKCVSQQKTKLPRQTVPSTLNLAGKSLSKDFIQRKIPFSNQYNKGGKKNNPVAITTSRKKKILAMSLIHIYIGYIYIPQKQ